MAKNKQQGKNTATALDNKIKGLEIELNYAIMKRREFGSVRYGGTRKTRELFEQWSDEVRRLQKELHKVQAQRAKIKTKKRQNTEDWIPF